MMVMTSGTKLFEPPSVNITGRTQVNITKVLDLKQTFIFAIVVKKLENLPKNKLKKVAEEELNVIHEEIYDDFDGPN